MAESMASGWCYLKNGAPPNQQVGPLTWAELYALRSSGLLAPADIVWHPTMPQWLPAAQVPGLFSAGVQPPAYPPGVQPPACSPGLRPPSSPPAGTAPSPQGTAPAEVGRPNAVRSALAMILNPGQVVKSALERVPWPFCLAVSGLAFTVFFLQTGLDMHRVGTAGSGAVIGYTFLGLGVGTIGVGLVAALAWALARPLGCGRSLEWTVRAFCLAYSATLIFAIIGLIFNLAGGWNTAVAFGITGALWAFYPMLGIVKEMTGEHLAASLALTTICGALIMSVWAVMGT
jgi:hypothetical protein